jgi:hypothetical protein
VKCGSTKPGRDVGNENKLKKTVTKLGRVNIQKSMILQGHMQLIAQAERGATKNLHLKKTVKVIQLANCYESRHGYLAIGG